MVDWTRINDLIQQQKHHEYMHDVSPVVGLQGQCEGTLLVRQGHAVGNLLPGYPLMLQLGGLLF